MSTNGIIVQSGELVAQRLFDVAWSIQLGQAEQLWSAHLGNTGSRSRLTTAPAKALSFGVPPLLLNLEPVALEIDGVAVTAQATGRLYDFGVVVLSLRVPIVDLPWPRFAERFNALERCVGATSECVQWARLLQQLRGIIAPAFQRPSEAIVEEDYLLGIVHGLNEPLDAASLPERVNLAGLLSGDQRPLSAAARRGLLQRSFSYFEDDLVVLTWDRAFIYQRRGESDVDDIIEVANAQLVEFRYYDELLDREMPQMYDRVEEARRAMSLLASRRFANLARKLYTLVAEVTELTGKVENALQVTEDVYLARIYTSALEAFRVSIFSAAVERKLAIIRDTYAALYEEASSLRAELLEVAIILLIVFEIVLAFFRP